MVYFMKNKLIKRVFDIIFSIFAIIIFSPVMIIISILIKIISPKGGIIYKQRRLGLNGKEFEVYKFRTMIPNAEKKLQEMMQKDPKLKQEYLTYRKLKNDPRIIPHIGNFLRKTSLDELPQFFNVLKGKMHVIGPKAEWDILVEEYKEKIPYYSKRHVVAPGITGWAQVNYHYGNSVEDAYQKLMYDLYYIKNWSLWLELKIIFKTILTIIK